MPIEKAVNAFLVEKKNCAQSVLHAFRDTHSVSDDDYALARGMGGGRAEGGLCGALWAALMLTPDAAVQARIRKAFAERAGFSTCREIKTLARTPCGECVRHAASLVAEKPAK